MGLSHPALPHASRLAAFTPARAGLSTALILAFLFSGALRPARAQSGSTVTVAAGTHALTVPWIPGPVRAGFNPALLAGIDRSIGSSEHWTFFYAVNLGFFRDRWWMSGVSSEPELGIGRTIPGGFRTDLRLGLGYALLLAAETWAP